MFNWLFLVAVLLATPVLAIVAVVRSVGLAKQLRSLEDKIAVLERRLATTDTSRVQTIAPTTATPPQPEPEATQSQSPLTPSPQAVSPVEAMPASTSVPTFLRADGAATTTKIGFEERFGTRWVVWVGGIALALGGVFLVRYSIEQGLVGPGVRIALGALLAAALIATGEWQRRAESQLSFPGVQSANIPSVLTAAGTTVAYATIYAAYALYGFLPPAAAFILLGVVALATLAAALLHGPALGGLGMIGAYLAPMLVASEEPDYWSLYIYLAVVNAAAFALARVRLWYWLALAALVLGALWSWPGTDPIYFSFVTALGAHVSYVVASFALAATFLVANLLYGPTAAPGAMDRLSNLALSIYLLAATVLVLASRHDPVALVPFILLTAAIVAIAWRSAAASAAVPVAAILATVVMAHWAVHEKLDALIAPPGVTAPAVPGPGHFDYGSHFAIAAFWAVLFGITGFLAQSCAARALVPMLWSAAAVFAPLAMLSALYYRVAALDRSLPFAGLALLLSAIYGAATETLVQREKRPGLMAGSAVFATGSLAALALALTFALEKGWLTIALALIALGAAWVAGKRPIPLLRWLAAAIAAIVVARIAYEPRIVGAEVGTTPILNWLLYGYGVPAASFWLGGWLLRKRADDLPARIVDAAAILFTVLLVTWEIRHYVTAGQIYKPLRGDLEIMLFATAGLAMTIGLEYVRVRTRSVIDYRSADLAGRPRKPYQRAGRAVQRLSARWRRFLQPYPAWLRFAGTACYCPCDDCPRHAADAVSRPCRNDVGGIGAVLSHTRSAAAVSWPGHVGLDQRCRAICLFNRLARLRYRTVGRRLRAALATGALSGAWCHCADHRQSIFVRHREYRRHIPRAIGDWTWRRAARHRLAVPARAVSAPPTPADGT